MEVNGQLHAATFYLQVRVPCTHCMLDRMASTTILGTVRKRKILALLESIPGSSAFALLNGLSQYI
jgi:hypothetical protein